MALRELRTFKPGDVVRLEDKAEDVEIIRTGDMGTTVRPLTHHTRDFTGWDGEGYKRVNFNARAKPITYAASSMAELIRAVQDE